MDLGSIYVAISFGVTMALGDYELETCAADYCHFSLAHAGTL